MVERDKYILRDAGEVIYRAGGPSTEAFLIMDGSVQVSTSDGLLLNSICVNEILGETSLLLDTPQTVTAIASFVGARATRIPRQYFAELSARDRVAAALVRKSQYRLIDSNKQSNMPGLEIDRIADLVEQAIGKQDGDSETVAALRKTLAAEVVFDRHLAHYPNTDSPSKTDEDNARLKRDMDTHTARPQIGNRLALCLEPAPPAKHQIRFFGLMVMHRVIQPLSPIADKGAAL